MNFRLRGRRVDDMDMHTAAQAYLQSADIDGHRLGNKKMLSRFVIALTDVIVSQVAPTKRWFNAYRLSRVRTLLCDAELEERELSESTIEMLCCVEALLEQIRWDYLEVADAGFVRELHQDIRKILILLPAWLEEMDAPTEEVREARTTAEVACMLVPALMY